jgi:hypothetical protein
MRLDSWKVVGSFAVCDRAAGLMIKVADRITEQWPEHTVDTIVPDLDGGGRNPFMKRSSLSNTVHRATMLTLTLEVELMKTPVGDKEARTRGMIHFFYIIDKRPHGLGDSVY